MRKKLAIINQRYGLEVNGGSEYYTRLIAEHLKPYYDVEILTTTAQNYATWENAYPAGDAVINGVAVKRFPVRRPRNMRRFRVVSKAVRILARLGIHADKLWILEQGPDTPELIRYIRENKESYDAFLFVTYLYYTTAMGLPEAAEKAILIPTAHDEPYIHFPIYENIFKSCRKIIFLTEEEKQFVQRKFNNQEIPNDVIGVGIELPAELADAGRREEIVGRFRSKYHVGGEYLIYAGRVDYGKNCDEMFAFFQEYKELHPKDGISLVIIGKDMMGVPKRPDIHYLGFVPEEDKYAGIAGAKFLWLPSQFESLSIALLEGMALGVPGLVNGRCEVLKGHCARSGGAVCYSGREDFMQRMSKLQDMPRENYLEMGKNAKAYVKENYHWDVVEEKLRNMIG